MADFNQQIGYPNNMGNQNPYMNTYNIGMNNPYNSNYINQMRGTAGVQQMSQLNGNSNQSTQYLKCRPVSSKEEARASQIDLDGSLWVFTDIGNEKIYTKQINNDGTASFKVYALVEDKIPILSSTDFVTKEEFNQTIQTLVAAMQTGGSQAPAQTQNQMEEKGKTAIVGF